MIPRKQPNKEANTAEVFLIDVLTSISNRRFSSCLSPLFQSESKCDAFHMEISFIHTQILVQLHVNKTNFHMKGFTLGLALKQRRKVTRKSPVTIKRQVNHFTADGFPRFL